MTLQALVGELKKRGIHVAAHEGELRLRAPRGALTAELREELQRLKPALLGWLAEADALPALAVAAGLPAADVESAHPLAPLQAAMVAEALRHPGSPAYFQQLVVEMPGDVDAAALAAAFRVLRERHPALRSRFVTGGAGLRQIVVRAPDLETRVHDRRRASDPAVALEEILAADRARGFDVLGGDLFRLAIVKRAADSVLVWSVSHALVDGWSFGVLQAELSAILAGRADTLAPAPPFAEFLAWREGLDAEAAEDFWRQELSGLDAATSVPRDVPAGGRPDHAELQVVLADAGLRAAAAAAGVTLASALQAAWALLLSRSAETHDVVFGLTVSGRPADLAGVERAVGLFINTVPVRLRVDPGVGARQFLRRVHEAAAARTPHEHLSLADIQSTSPLGPALLDHVLVFENQPVGADSGLDVARARLHERIGYDLGVVAAPHGDGLALRFLYDRAAYSDAQVARVSDHLRDALAFLAGAADAPLRSFVWPGRAERTRVVEHFNDTRRELTSDTAVVDVFERQARRVPDTAAVVRPGALSYAALDAEASRVAGLLGDVRSDEPVGILMPRSPAMLAAILGVLKAGGAYLPLGWTLPAERLHLLVRRSGVRAVVADAAARPRLQGFGGRVVDPSAPHEGAGGRARSRRGAAYVIHTSGSTGVPKGVVVEHAAVVNRIAWMQRRWPLAGDDVILFKTPYTFDVSVWELFWWAFAGASVAVLGDGDEKDPAAVVDAVEAARVTTLHFVPSMLAPFLDHVAHSASGPRLRTLRRVFVSGEALDTRHVEQFERVLRPHTGAALVNLYGPTEATVDVSFFDCGGWTGRGPVPIGRPIDNLRLYVLGRDLEPRPVGVPGEIYIGGAGVARGYLGAPDASAERFVPDPFAGPGARMYRSGDVGRWDDDGELHYLGRADLQLKVRGQRVEPGEVETHLLALPGVRQAAVVGVATATGTELHAFVVGHVDAEGVRRALRERVPDALVPSRVRVLAQLPVGATGKTDRKALLALETLEAAPVGRAAADEVERSVARVFAAVLSLADCPVDADFFAMGGHSLKALEVVSRVRAELGVELRLSDVFERPTAAGLAAAVRAVSPVAATPIPFVPDADDYAASHAQRRLWVLSQWEGGDSAYNVPGALLLDGPLDVPRLRRAWDRVVAGHEILRTFFRVRDGELRQVVAADGATLEVVDVPDEAAATAWVAEASRRAFDLQRGPLVRAAVLVLGTHRHVLFFNAHHAVWDGGSLRVLLREISTAYAGAPIDDPGRRLQHRDVAAWSRGLLDSGALDTAKAYWQETLGDGPAPLDLPADHPRPATRSFRGARTPLAVDPALQEKLRVFCRTQGVTTFTALTAAVKVLLHRLTGARDVSIGTPVSGRDRRELAGQLGLFVDTVVLRDAVDPAQTFRDYVLSVKRTTRAALQHRAYPFDQLVELLDVPRDPSRSPLFDVMVTMDEGTAAEELRLDGVAARGFAEPPPVSRFDLTFSFASAGDALAASVEWSRDLFEEDRIARLGAHFFHLLGHALDEPDLPLGRLALLAPGEEQAALAVGAGRPLAPPADVLTLFHAQAAARPDAVAVRCGDTRLTYAELAREASRLAARLRACGVGAEARVAIALPRTERVLVAVLGVLEAGAAFVPLDVAHPAARLQALARGCTAVIADDGAWPCPVVRVDGEGEAGTPARAPHPRALAYVIFTSGSTGEPKGCAVEHASLAAYLDWCRRAYGHDQPVDMPLFTSLAVDLTITSLLLPLVSGGCVHVVRDEGTPLDHVRGAFTSGARCVKLTPGHAALLAPAGVDGSAVELAIVGGEVLGAAAVAALRAARPSVRIVDEYGPTEATVGCVTADVEAAPGAVGRPIDGTAVYVLDREMRPVPPGVTGEIWVGGACVTRGYVGRPDLTAERFRPDPFGGAAGARLYRTGDLGRWNAGGALEFLGRADAQVKVRGHRVEPLEVEAAVRSVAGVREAAVLAIDAAGGAELHAFVTGSVDEADVRTALQAVLPEPLVPSRVHVVDPWPLAASGKVDRRALRRAVAAAAPVARRAFRSVAEERVAAIFSDVLGAAAAPEADFFALGGHSLKALQVVGRIHAELGVEVGLAEVFAHRTVEGLAAVLAERAPSRFAPITPAPPAAEYAVSDAQRRLWVLSQWEGGAAAYNVPGAWEIDGPLDVPGLQAAFAAAVLRHAVLATRFRVRDGELRQLAGPLPVLEVVDVAEDEVAGWLSAAATAPFTLDGGPLVRAALLRVAPSRHVLFLSVHHAVWDGESASVFFRDLAAASAGMPLPALPLQYRDYAEWQRAGRGDEHAAYWRERLQDLSALDLPADRPRPAVRSFRGGRVRRRIAPRVAAALRELCAREGATPFMGVLALVDVLLHRLTGATDVAVATPVSGRDRPELAGQVGLFVNTLVLRTGVRPAASFREVLAAARATALGAYAHRDHPFDRLVEELPVARDPARSPLADVAVAWEEASEAGLHLQGLAARAVLDGPPASRYDLAFAFAPDGDALAVVAEYSSDLFDAPRIERTLGQLEVLLAAAVEAPDVPVRQLPVIDADERERLAAFERGGTAPNASTLLAAFQARVAERAAATAVVDGDVRLTYAELDARSTALAHALAGRGVGPEVRVAVALPRSADLVVSLLAVWKAGGAFMPVDPESPAQRLSSLLARARAALVIARESGGLPAGLPRMHPATSARGGARPVPHPRQAAYVLHTSGSTGTPKAVVVEHGSFAAMAATQVAALGLQPSDRVVQFAAPVFDASLYEVALALASGGTLVVAPDEARGDARLFRRFLAASGATVAVLPPSFLHALGHEPLAGLRLLVTAGEAAVEADAAAHASRLHYVNAYGPTEFSVCATLHDVRGEAAPIGRPIAGTTAYVLDASQERVPPGVYGELALGGGGVARGYLADPAATAERFVPDPFSPHPGARMYRSGDRARWSASGELEYAGRIDLQVKVRGHRVEPGEVEHALLGLDGVTEAAVVASGGELVAFVAGSPGDVQARLRERLPEFMVPARVHVLPRLPRQASGKVDRAALVDVRPAGDAGRAPQDDVERAVARVFADVLGTPSCTAGDDFFALGGHSLRAMQAVGRLRDELDVDLALPELFAHPTVEALAAVLRRRAPRVSSVIPFTADAPDYPVSDAQRRLFVLSQWAGGAAAYNVPGAVSLRGPLDVGRLSDAWRTVTARHEALRTAYRVRDGAVRQVVADSGPALEVLAPRTRGAAAEWIAAAARDLFDL